MIFFISVGAKGRFFRKGKGRQNSNFFPMGGVRGRWQSGVRAPNFSGGRVSFSAGAHIAPDAARNAGTNLKMSPCAMLSLSRGDFVPVRQIGDGGFFCAPFRKRLSIQQGERRA
ncbi:MAG: hypothetical protein DBX55_03810 [Verrucomicrobia bacterium]|nr:MAG: hypothetical protein DBX55_03810 [Verrucomicrobiota bacterium]